MASLIAFLGKQRNVWRGAAARSDPCSGRRFATQRYHTGLLAVASVAVLFIKCLRMASASRCYHSAAGRLRLVVFQLLVPRRCLRMSTGHVATEHLSSPVRTHAPETLLSFLLGVVNGQPRSRRLWASVNVNVTIDQRRFSACCFGAQFGLEVIA